MRYRRRRSFRRRRTFSRRRGGRIRRRVLRIGYRM